MVAICFPLLLRDTSAQGAMPCAGETWKNIRSSICPKRMVTLKSLLPSSCPASCEKKSHCPTAPCCGAHSWHSLAQRPQHQTREKAQLGIKSSFYSTGMFWSNRGVKVTFTDKKHMLHSYKRSNRYRTNLLDGQMGIPLKLKSFPKIFHWRRCQSQLFTSSKCHTIVFT